MRGAVIVRFLALFFGALTRGPRTWISARAEEWQRFWYTPADPTTLGLLRWLVGAMLVYTHIVWGLELEGMFGSQGWHRPELMQELQRDQYAFSFWWYVPDQYLFPVHVACVSVLVMFMVGLATPVTSILSIAINTSYCYRAQLATYGLDQGNAMLLLYLTIGGAGQALSLDRVLGRWWSRMRGGEVPESLRLTVCTARANLGYRLIQYHYCVIYLIAGLSKLQGAAWWNGDAFWLAASNLEYQSRDLTWLAWHPWICYAVTHITIIWEVSFSALIWKPALRLPMLFMGFLMHLGIAAFMGMWTFGSIMIFGYLGFIPDIVNPLVHQLGAWRGTSPGFDWNPVQNTAARAGTTVADAG